MGSNIITTCPYFEIIVKMLKSLFKCTLYVLASHIWKPNSEQSFPPFPCMRQKIIIEQIMNIYVMHIKEKKDHLHFTSFIFVNFLSRIQPDISTFIFFLKACIQNVSQRLKLNLQGIWWLSRDKRFGKDLKAVLLWRVRIIRAIWKK